MRVASPDLDEASVHGASRVAANAAAKRVRGELLGLPAWLRWGLVVFVLLAVTWPFGSPVPRPGLDRSWQIGLAMAFSQGLVFGRQIILNYGPLAFAIHPYRTGADEYAAALAIGALVQVGLLVALLTCMRRTMGTVVAVLGAFVLASLIGETQADPLTAVAFGMVVLTLTAPPERAAKAARMLAIGGGALAAVALMMKVNNGLDSTCIIALGLLGTARPWRALAEGAASFIIAVVVIWLALGQPLAALPDYFRLSYNYIQGYADGAERGTGEAAYTPLLLILLGSTISLSVGAWVSMSDRDPRRQWALTLSILTLNYFLYREISTRAGAHKGIYLALLAAVAAMIPWRGHSRWLGIALAAGLWSATFAFYPSTPAMTLVPVQRARAMVTQIERARHAPKVASESSLIKAVDLLPGPVLAGVQGHCVSAEPTEIAVIWAYQLRWCPLPALQSYDAATSTLDHLDSAAYNNPRLDD